LNQICELKEDENIYIKFSFPDVTSFNLQRCYIETMVGNKRHSLRMEVKIKNNNIEIFNFSNFANFLVIFP